MSRIFKSLWDHAALSLGLAASAHAVEMRHAFEVQWTVGADAGTTSRGWFSYDSAVVGTGQQVIDASTGQAVWFVPRSDLLSGFGFDFRGTTYGLSSVSTDSMFFDLDGRLRSTQIGTNCRPLVGCTQDNPNATTVFNIGFYGGPDHGQVHAQADVPFSFFQNNFSGGTWQASPVPEPAPVALLAGGLALMAGVAKRRRSTTCRG